MPDAALKKLLIEGYADARCIGKPKNSISAMINPEKLSRNFRIKYYPSKEIGANKVTQRYGSMESSGFELDLIVDGTGVVPIPPGGGKTVDGYILKLKQVIYQYYGSEHRPNYLKISWGRNNFIGVCEKLSVHYTLFNPDGTALRATVKITLLETTDFRTKLKEGQKSSPDLTHILTVKAGDNLPLMSYRIYGDSSYYIEVAKANGIKSFLSVKPGDRIFFPPIKK